MRKLDVLYVDHCHTTGRIRGLLCQKCNTGIGMLGDTRQDIEAALRYFDRTVDKEVE